jgi:hypothetical protein
MSSRERNREAITECILRIKVVAIHSRRIFHLENSLGIRRHLPANQTKLDDKTTAGFVPVVAST